MNEIDKKFINDTIENQAFFIKMIKEQERENAKLNAIIDSYQPRLQRYKDILQEIKEIAEKELSYDMVGNEHRHYRNYDIIRHLITKAEEE